MENPILIPKWKNRTSLTHTNHLKEYSDKSFKVALLGDSLTEFWKETEYWKSADIFKEAANLGVGGDEIQHLLYRISGDKVDGNDVTSILDVIQVEKIVLMIGTNNSSTKRTPEQIAEGLSKVIDIILSKTFKQSKANLIIYGITYRRDVSIDKIRDINNLYQELVQKIQDTQDIEKTQINYRTLDITEQDLIDNVHFNEEGYRKWYEDLKIIL